MSKTLRITLGGVMAALVFVATYAIRLPVSVTQGYIHLGDGFILLGAALLGPVAIPAAAVGSMLADLLGGYTMYIVPTFLIKGGMCAVAVWAARSNQPLWLAIAGFAAAELVMVAGYFAVEWLALYGLHAAAAAVVPNLVQGLGGVVMGVVLLPAVRRIRLPKR